MTIPEGWTKIDYTPDPDDGKVWTVGNQVWHRWNWKDELVCECQDHGWAEIIVRLLREAHARGPAAG